MNSASVYMALVLLKASTKYFLLEQLGMRKFVKMMSRSVGDVFIRQTEGWGKGDSQTKSVASETGCGTNGIP